MLICRFYSRLKRCAKVSTVECPSLDHPRHTDGSNAREARETSQLNTGRELTTISPVGVSQPSSL